MTLPRKLEKFVGKLTVQTEIESRLLPVLLEQLEYSLKNLRKVAGSGALDSFEKMVSCVFKEGSGECLDRFEESLESDLARALRRELTDGEEAVVGVLLEQITGTIEALLILGGIELTDAEEEPEDEDD